MAEIQHIRRWYWQISLLPSMMPLIELIQQKRFIEKKWLRMKMQRGVVVDLQAPGLRKEDSSRARIRNRNSLLGLRITQSVRLVGKLIRLSCVGGLQELALFVVLWNTRWYSVQGQGEMTELQISSLLKDKQHSLLLHSD